MLVEVKVPTKTFATIPDLVSFREQQGSKRSPRGALTVSEISRQKKVVLWWTRWRSYGVVICKVRAPNMKPVHCTSFSPVVLVKLNRNKVLLDVPDLR